MNVKTELPPTWHASVWPEGWDFEKDHYPEPNMKRFGYVLLPDRFQMVLHWPELADGRSEHGGAVIVSFEVLDDALEIRELYGVDLDLGEWMTHLVAEFPPSKWKSYAVAEMTRFFAIDDQREAVSVEAAGYRAAAVARKGVDLQKKTPSGRSVPETRKRYRITDEHLKEVVRVYTEAAEAGEPPTKAVAELFEVAHSTAAKWVGAARRKGMLDGVTQKRGSSASG
ncbi:hypothetical protein ACLQ2E_18025 [Streptomyces lavendulocolor]